MTAFRRELAASLVAVALIAGCGSGGSSSLPQRTGSPGQSRTASLPSTSAHGSPTRTPGRSTAPETSTVPETSTAQGTSTGAASSAPPRTSTAPSTSTAPRTRSASAAPSRVTTTIPRTASTATAVPTSPAPAATALATSPEATSSSTTPWGWIALAVLLVVAITATGLVLHRRSRRRWETWRKGARASVDAALLSRDLLPVHGRDIADVAHWEAVRTGAEQTSRDLQVAGKSAPTADAAGVARSTAEALSGLTFALESARLMQAAQPPPTANQLADADAVTQARRADLDVALGRLDVVVGPPEPASATPSGGAT